MASRGYFRGHPIVWVKDRWLYADNYEPLPSHGGKTRPCVKCGKLFSLEEGDPCLGILPGVNNACCGHGVRSESYIRFTNGVVLKEFIIKSHKNDRSQETRRAHGPGEA